MLLLISGFKLNNSIPKGEKIDDDKIKINVYLYQSLPVVNFERKRL